MTRVGRKLINDKKSAILASALVYIRLDRFLGRSRHFFISRKGTTIEKASVQDRDILSILIRANLASDLPDSQRLSDEDVLAQIPTFLLAGHETTA
jgi:hypothetical protein